MTSLIEKFVASRAAKPAPQPIANAGDYVSRADFNKLATVVNGMAKAVEALIEDIDAATNPEKMQAVFNTALKDVMPAINAARRGTTPRTALAPAGDRPADRGYLCPSDDDDGAGNIVPPIIGKPSALHVNAKPGDRKPLALPADRTFLAPKGE